MLKVCLCGRANVGKSSLFNRLFGKKKALVLDQPGVTRDVRTAQVEWDGQCIEIADLAGLEEDSKKNKKKDTLRNLANKVAVNYIQTADLVLFLVDSKHPLLPQDMELASQIRKFGKKVLVVAAKADNMADYPEAENLGWGSALSTSAEHRLGIETLKEQILAELLRTEHLRPELLRDARATKVDTKATEPWEERSTRPIKLGVYGRPNVGKSTFANLLLGEQRMITSAIPGTTIDTIDSDFTHGGKSYRILDTAGVRKKSKTKQGVEVLSVVQSLNSLSQVDIALILMDGFEGVTDQDEKITSEILKAGKPLILIINKWDLCNVSKSSYSSRVRDALGFLDFAPLLFVSALKGEGLRSLWDLIDEILKGPKQQIKPMDLSRFFKLVQVSNNPQGAKIHYAHFISRKPPTIVCFVNNPKKFIFSFERYLKNELYKRYGWVGWPIRLIFRKK